MNLLNSLLNLLKKKEPQSKNNHPEGVCPNCWGRHEYGGQFFEAVKNNNFDVNSKSQNVGWVQDYANKHLTGIQLMNEDDHSVCQKCKVTYKPTA
ncbi:MAG: hypothetical protein NXI23_12880 [Bacteroidetes bacterium]|jgi:protein-arginine kinase activator protein McsA|nr:hypothetical protein [Bacteroidota bacterium]MDF1865160.1 hypothetical protein [Saprospiraceae bacterium]